MQAEQPSSSQGPVCRLLHKDMGGHVQHCSQFLESNTGLVGRANGNLHSMIKSRKASRPKWHFPFVHITPCRYCTNACEVHALACGKDLTVVMATPPAMHHPV